MKKDNQLTKKEKALVTNFEKASAITLKEDEKLFKNLAKDNHSPKGKFTMGDFLYNNPADTHNLDKVIEDIAKKIDPNNTFLNECEDVVNRRFGKDIKSQIEKEDLCELCEEREREGGYRFCLKCYRRWIVGYNEGLIFGKEEGIKIGEQMEKDRIKVTNWREKEFYNRGKKEAEQKAQDVLKIIDNRLRDLKCKLTKAKNKEKNKKEYSGYVAGLYVRIEELEQIKKEFG